MSQLLICKNVSKTYQENDAALVQVLNKVNFEINKAEQVAILGSSGSGKSTLLHILGALDTPTSGQVLFNGQDIFQFTEKQQADFRNKCLGFVYQFHHLLPEFTALENVAMPLLIGKCKTELAKHKAEEILKRVGLGHRLDHKPSQMSGGERQRSAIARALVTQPDLVLADEPTGNLDHTTGQSIYHLLNELREQISTSFIVVTHDIELAAKLDRTLHITDGKLVEQGATV
ncbi:lipoprotein-releasing ABC transporter ATP-binding protein LolD [Aliiglaciecola sp. 3_MG-2023]|uniref:lipoprotein-releasing ABC transporter ATP-binding protein LolD n=1 Tax=Aliiglaciecola sp. 3_MG-2023 TaxID=3062644 RepID=UPI0026E2A37A|nr:lipoprotein-releasing ABC transporter ATP-binding protein LolD [Aliiglaciecola sp. 3_MG-2023]MDO6692438.1 lipoprotein-releasing ABC transporter ATP-binding protein LolD [Aliiglaciecola sp. 3_MG-2023]